MSDGKKNAFEEESERIWRQRVKVVQGSTPAELLKIFDDLKDEIHNLKANDLSLTWRQHTRLKSIEALIQKLP